MDVGGGVGDGVGVGGVHAGGGGGVKGGDVGVVVVGDGVGIDIVVALVVLVSPFRAWVGHERGGLRRCATFMPRRALSVTDCGKSNGPP